MGDAARKEPSSRHGSGVMFAPILIVAGPNGSGKTTVTVRLREERWSEGVEYLNPDDVARDRFGDWNDPKAVLASESLEEPRNITFSPVAQPTHA